MENRRRQSADRPKQSADFFLEPSIDMAKFQYGCIGGLLIPLNSNMDYDIYIYMHRMERIYIFFLITKYLDWQACLKSIRRQVTPFVNTDVIGQQVWRFYWFRMSTRLIGQYRYLLQPLFFK